MRRMVVVLVLVLVATIWPGMNGIALGSATMSAAAARSLQADFNNDGFADLAVAAPFEALGTIVEAGAVTVLYGTATGLTGIGSQLFTQDTPGVGSNAEDFDRFGSVLAASGP